jgi:hypothetical protein
MNLWINLKSFMNLWINKLINDGGTNATNMFAHQDSLYLCKDRHKLNDVINTVCTVGINEYCRIRNTVKVSENVISFHTDLKWCDGTFKISSAVSETKIMAKHTYGIDKCMWAENAVAWTRQQIAAIRYYLRELNCSNKILTQWRRKDKSFFNVPIF